MLFLIDISIHALLAESDVVSAELRVFQVDISIHALLAESDLGTINRCTIRAIFLSTLSLRRATWAATVKCTFAQISIHALLAESDSKFGATRICKKVISIHALLAESDAS